MDPKDDDNFDEAIFDEKIMSRLKLPNPFKKAQEKDSVLLNKRMLAHEVGDVINQNSKQFLRGSIIQHYASPKYGNRNMAYSGDGNFINNEDSPPSVDFSNEDEKFDKVNPLKPLSPTSSYGSVTFVRKKTQN